MPLAHRISLLAGSLLLAAASGPPPAPAAIEFDHAHAAWTAILAERVKEGHFDYAALARDPAPLVAYLESLQAVTPKELEGWSREERYAFWINAYNAYTVRKVVDNYPLKSIRDQDGFLGLKSVFDDEFIPMKGHHPEGEDDPLSLNDIEHGILRPGFEDARVHAAVNCASKSCPPLRAEAFVAARLDEQLDGQMRAFVNDPTRNRLDREAGRLRLSKVFDWFEEDFERDAGSVREYVARWVPEEDREAVSKAKIGFLDYDWALNDVPGGKD